MADDMRAALIRLLPRLRRFGMALTGSQAEADELVQDTCERAMKRQDQLRESSRLDAWLYGIMRNRWTDELRSRRVRRHDEIEAAHTAVGEEGEQTAHARITLAAVRKALATLPAEQRSVLVLVCVDGLSYQEAADVLGVAIGTVMSRLARGRRALYAAMHGVTAPEMLNVFPISGRKRSCPG